MILLYTVLSLTINLVLIYTALSMSHPEFGIAFLLACGFICGMLSFLEQMGFKIGLIPNKVQDSDKE